ncbi:ATP-binding protein [Campylobacter sp. VBCF_01 NA2]|uniref:ATP-binding protein n=1 Tax=Campylobacter sp. VBCF_01 NA2 TaxID=2983836 RepID=UPI0022EA070C|nr:DUF87 domain-containing protein [Campylobacter sp. VBCF_01 NA2]WBR54535.1 DUF87 domain-containing protein [Campylobacter sp. VBCF_01 NA2]
MINKIVYNRFFIFTSSILLFIIFHKSLTGDFLPTTETKDIWFYSGLATMIISLLFIEPFYTSPKNVFTNSFALVMVYLAVKNNYANNTLWWIIFSFFISILFLSIVVIILGDYGKNQSENNILNIVTDNIKKFIIIFGQGKLLYSIVFISTLLLYYKNDDFNIFIWFIFWFFILLIDPKKLHTSFSFKTNVKSKEAIGRIFAIQSNKIFLVKMYEDKQDIKKFSVIEFSNNSNKSFKGFILDIYYLNNQLWAKICVLQESKNIIKDKNIVFLINDDIIKNKINSFVGIVSENSDILKIKFEYSKINNNIEKGDLLEIEINGEKIFYQITNGITESEFLEQKNKFGYIIGEAIQLGKFNQETLEFEKFGWVPNMYSPIFIVNNISNKENIDYPEYKLGIIPKTNISSIVNLHDMVNYHTALIGVTGSGKSFLAKEIIKALINDTKVICVDFNNEYIKYFSNMQNIIKNDDVNEIQQNIDNLVSENEKYANQQNRTNIATWTNNIKTKLRNNIEVFLSSDDNLTTFNLPDFVNNISTLEYIKFFFKEIFEMAKNSETQNKRILIVIEEAHTIVPEWNFTGTNDKTSQGVVNTISQIALQGRKYNIGFMIIGQRTANISKTILTQCNTMICFQSFDETNYNFLSNYIGKDLAQSLSGLKKYHAVVAGKAIKSNLPLIINTTAQKTEQ